MVNLQNHLIYNVKFHLYGDDDIVHYTFSEKEQKEGIYLPIGSFITAYAREKTIRTSQAIKDYSIKKYGKDMYIYSDTDSIHTMLSIEELEKFCDIDNVRLGAWKNEGFATRRKICKTKMLFRRNRRKNKYNVRRYAEILL